MLSARHILARRQTWCLTWAGFGLCLFLLAYFWAPGLAALRMVFYLFFLLPFLLALPLWGLDFRRSGGWITLSALLFAGVSALSTLWGETASFGFYGKQLIFLAVWLLGLCWLFAHRPPNLPRLYRLLTLAGVASVPVLLLSFYWSHPLGQRLEGWGVLSNPTIIAQGYGLIALLAYVQALQSRAWPQALGWLVLALLAVLPVILSQSRGAALALVLAGLLALALLRPSRQIWLTQVSLAAVVLLLVVLFTPIVDILRERGLSWSHRDGIWSEVFRQSLAHPWFGIGWVRDAEVVVSWGRYHHAHNSWLDIFYRTGLLGLALALWHLLLLLRGFSRRGELMPAYLWLVFGCLCLFTNGWGLLSRPDAQWLMYWIPAGLIGAWLAAAPPLNLTGGERP